jgi:hypothetical protein
MHWTWLSLKAVRLIQARWRGFLAEAPKNRAQPRLGMAGDGKPAQLQRSQVTARSKGRHEAH